MRISVKQMTLAGVLGSLMIVLGGMMFIPALNLSGAMTIMHIPIIIGAILCGPMIGLLLGVIFAVVVTIMFSGSFPWYVLVPARLLIGPVAYLVYILVKKLLKSEQESRQTLGDVIGCFLVLATVSIGGYFLWPSIQILSIWLQIFIFIVAAMIVTGVIYWFWKTKAETTAITMSAVFGTLANSIGTLGLGVLFPTILGETIPVRFKVALGIFASNSVLELIIAVVICIALIPPLQAFLNREKAV